MEAVARGRAAQASRASAARRPERHLVSPAIRTLMRRRFAELAGLGLAALAIALILALAAYNPRDPSLNTATSQPVTNVAGPIGASVADLLLQGFGLAGCLPALALLIWAWRVGTHRGFGSVWLRLLPSALAVPALSAAFSVASTTDWPTHAGLGGAAGHLLADAALGSLPDALAPLGSLCVFLAGALLGTGLALTGFGLSLGDWRMIGRVGAAGTHRAASLAATMRPTRRSEPTPAAPVLRQPAAFESAEPAADALPATPKAAPARPHVTVSPRRSPPPRQESLPLMDAGWRFPPTTLLKAAPARGSVGPSEESLQNNARLLESVLADYGVQGAIREIRPGPVVTMYELEPAPGIRSARVIGLADDVARSLSVTAVRIATVPGRNVIGIEVPNAKRETVYLSELLESEAWTRQQGRLLLALGKDIAGEPIVTDLARMPHLLIAGTTGSGKSVGINAMILSLLMRLPPDQCRLILIDPKMLELSVYEGIPHLMAPVVTEPAKAVSALKWVVREMERRYRSMSQLGVRNIGGYNERVEEARARGEVITRRVQTGYDPETHRPVFEDQALSLEQMPFIVVVIDEMADLMMVAGKDIEAAVQRLAQMARAAGIHVIMATQRPSVDVITGTIKANFPTRISFQVISKFDSRTILGEQGSEQLLGHGDMLYMAGGGRITRVHGPLVTDREVEEVVEFLREQGEPVYLDDVTESLEEGESGPIGPMLPGGAFGDGDKGLFDQAVDIVSREGKASTSFLQRHLQIGYNRAAKLIEQMEKEGIVSAANHVGKREVLVRRRDD